MSWKKIVKWIPLVFVGVVIATLGVTANAGQSPTQKKHTNPEAGLSDTERMALHDDAHARNVKYLNDFVTRGADPRSLPVLEILAYGAAPATAELAVKQADLIVYGKVRAVSFQARPTGLPVTIATFEVLTATKGQAPATITVQQVGGPVAQGNGGALAQLENDPLLLSGSEAVLLLTRDATDSAVYRTVAGAGVNLVAGGGVQAQEGNPFADKINGRSVADILNTLRG